LEYEEQFSDGHGKIHDLDWASTPDNQSILGVGFPHKAIVYGQLRFDYLDARPAWAALRVINTREFTSHPIGDSVWLGGGSFVIGAGNQLFVQDEKIVVSEELRPDVRISTREKSGINIFTLVSRLNGPLPIYHPQYLAQCLLSGKTMLVQRILLKLWKSLKFYSDGDDFDSMLGFPIEEFWTEGDMSSNATKKEIRSSYADFSEEDPETLTEEVAASLNELLTSRQVPLLSSREQFILADTIECVGTVEKHRRSMDVNGCRFLLFFRQHSLRESQHFEQDATLSWREITWAFHSTSQDILADLVSRHFNGKMLWKHARECGIFMWMTDLTALVSIALVLNEHITNICIQRAQFEVIARNEYTKTEEKNPVDCSLYYIALKKKAVLTGLWRMATWSREQGAVQKLLSNNFNEPRWQTAALKNAYALMGKRRFGTVPFLYCRLKIRR
jgi:hypothetical protein